jgi:hypothetical protein
MIFKKAILLAALVALSSTPAWALRGGAQGNQGGPHPSSGKPVAKGNPHGGPGSEPGHSHSKGAGTQGDQGNANKGAGQQGNQGNPDKGNGGGKGNNGTGNGNGAGKGKGKGGGSGTAKSKSHRCLPHAVAYVASGTLVSETITEGANHTFSGEVTIEVTHGNRHATSDKGTKKVYKLEGARLTLAVPDLDKDNVVGIDDLAPGDHAQVIGRITTLAKKCTVSGFTPQLTVEKIVFHGPRH